MDSAWVTAAAAAGQFLIALLGAAFGVTWAMHNTESRLRDRIDINNREIREEIDKRADVFQTILGGLRLDIHGVSMYARENIGRLNALLNRNGASK